MSPGSLITKLINPECYKVKQRRFLGHLSTSRTLFKTYPQRKIQADYKGLFLKTVFNKHV